MIPEVLEYHNIKARLRPLGECPIQNPQTPEERRKRMIWNYVLFCQSMRSKGHRYEKEYLRARRYFYMTYENSQK